MNKIGIAIFVVIVLIVLIVLLVKPPPPVKPTVKPPVTPPPPVKPTVKPPVTPPPPVKPTVKPPVKPTVTPPSPVKPTVKPSPPVTPPPTVTPKIVPKNTLGSPCTPTGTDLDQFAVSWAYDGVGGCKVITECIDPYTVSGNKCVSADALKSTLSTLNQQFANFSPAIQNYIIMKNIPAAQSNALMNIPSGMHPGAMWYLASMYFDSTGNISNNNNLINNFNNLSLSMAMSELQGISNLLGLQSGVKEANTVATNLAEVKAKQTLNDTSQSITSKDTDVKFTNIAKNNSNVGLISSDKSQGFQMNFNSGIVASGPIDTQGTINGKTIKYIFQPSSFSFDVNQYSLWLKPDGSIVTKDFAGSTIKTKMFSSKSPETIKQANSSNRPYILTVDNTGNLMISSLNPTASGLNKTIPVQFN